MNQSGTGSRIRPSWMNYAGGRKRIFIGLLSSACFVVCALIFLFMILPWLFGVPGWLPPASVGAGCFLIVTLSWLCIALVYHLHTGRRIPGAPALHHALTGLFLPLMQALARPLGLGQGAVLKSFVKVNNQLTLARTCDVRPERLLILVPHCLQADTCSQRLSHDPDNCRRCGKCPVGGLLDLRDKYGVRLAVATGGTIARRIVVRTRPKCISAVACERDLASGIQDSYPVPVFGILNERPCGPCLNTLVDLSCLEAALKNFIPLERQS